MANKNNSFYVAIAGNIGVGKTTLTGLLCERFGWTPFYEKFVDNPYLEDFYEDMPAFAFQSQVFFLKERMKDHLQIHDIETSCVQDRTVYEDAEIFAKNLYLRKAMTERDYRVYVDLYETLQGFLRAPDLFVYLRASAWTLISRIRKRGRSYEQSIDKEYLMQLNLIYENWAMEKAESDLCLVVDTENYDINADTGWRDSIVSEIGRLAGEKV